jgi:hypothetical protein
VLLLQLLLLQLLLLFHQHVSAQKSPFSRL